MRIQNILIFIEEVKKINRLSQFDIRLHQLLFCKFEKQSPQKKLDSADVQFLIDCFKDRCNEILGSKYDYTVNIGLANQKWIQFAKDVASFSNKKYLQILLPGINNTVDYNYISLLTETNKLENFYLGEGNKVLYRKRGLGEHLQKNQFYLSTCRNLGTNKLSAVSINELSRLEIAKDLNTAFSIGDEFFSNFWDFLQKKAFVKLQSKGSMPLDLLPHLLGLIEQYYRLKNEGKDFATFKNAVQLFFKIIYKNKLKNINYFYGEKIQFKNKQYYLLDFLVVINKAEFYVLDEHLEALLTWLFQFNPILSATNDELKPLYMKFQKNNFNYSKRDSLRHGQLLNLCLNFLLSLMTTEFEIYLFGGHTISIWDKTNTVFNEAGLMFSLFEPLLQSNQIDELAPQYDKIIKQYISSARADNSFFTWATRFNSENQWYRHVENNTLHEIGVNWVEPELIIYALLQFQTSNPDIMIQVNKMMDEVIHTYSQNKTTLLKQFRVNIQFNDFRKKLTCEDQKHLMILIELCKKFDFKEKFINNCIYHIVNQLAQMTDIESGGAIQFFVAGQRIDFAKLLMPYTHFDHLNKIIDALKTRLHSPSLRLNPKMVEPMTLYLRSLSRPISTIEEQLQTRNNSNAADYIGAPS